TASASPSVAATVTDPTSSTSSADFGSGAGTGDARFRAAGSADGAGGGGGGGWLAVEAGDTASPSPPSAVVDGCGDPSGETSPAASSAAFNRRLSASICRHSATFLRCPARVSAKAWPP